MDKIIVQAVATFFRILLRCWINGNENSDILNPNLTDITQFAERCGLSYFEAKKFNRIIEGFVDKISKEFIDQFGNQLESAERKKAIANQIQKDVQKINLDQNTLISLALNPVSLQLLIMDQSKCERELWSLDEIGIYTNCVKYISRAGIDFITRLPAFSSAALSAIIKRQEEFENIFSEILSELRSMEELVKNSELQFREYESIYRENIVARYGKIELIGSKIQDRHVKRYDISSAYVELNCISYKSREELLLSKVFQKNSIVWIKGEAGAGKTTFLQWIAVCSAKGERIAIENIENTIPIVIELRNIDWPFDLKKVVNKTTSAQGIYCPDGWIYELLKRQKVIFLFDGLDEISKEKRDEIYDYIEEVVRKYPQIKVVLTARNSVKDNINCAKTYYEIMPMKMNRIKDFIEYWHESVLRRDAVIEDYEIKNLKDNLMQKIIENNSLKELACNPLLCAMLCALNYVNNEQLPDNKMQLYEQCCEMLVDARDSQRNIDIKIYNDLPKLDYLMKRRILEEIAFRMLNNGTNSESKQSLIYFLIQLLTNTNILSGIKNYSECAENILNFLTERSGIIREVEEGTIDFIHRTFMEFLSVKTICRNANWNILIKEVCNVDWRETIIMCFGEMSNENIEFVLNNLVSKGKLEGDDRYFLMASLCLSNAQFFYAPIKEEIDRKIKGMIPPSDEKIEEMSQLGPHLLVFLKNSEEYTLQEKQNCLRLLANIRIKEAIPVILTYVCRFEDELSFSIYQFAVDLLWKYSSEELEEYNAKGILLDNLITYVFKGEIIIYETIFYILNNCFLNSNFSEFFKSINRIIVYGQENKIQKGGKTDFGKYFEKCECVNIIGNTKNLGFLNGFMNIKRLEIQSNTNLLILTYELKELSNLISVQTLYFRTSQSELRYISRMSENMKNLELIEIYLENEDLCLTSDTFDHFLKLKEVRFFVSKLLANQIEKKKFEVKGVNKDLYVSIIQCH